MFGRKSLSGLKTGSAHDSTSKGLFLFASVRKVSWQEFAGFLISSQRSTHTAEIVENQVYLCVSSRNNLTP